MRKINAPAIEVNEIDRSQYNTNYNSGTVCVLPMFADKSDDYDPKYVTSMNDYITTYGYPTNEAERYGYFAAKEIFDNNGSLIAAKLPYDNKSLNKFTYTKYVVDETVSTLVSPYDIIQKFYDGNRNQLRKAFTLEEQSVSNLVTIITSKLNLNSVEMAKDFLSDNIGFDFDLHETIRQLFGSSTIFHNLSALLENKFEDIAPVAEEQYLTNFKLLKILGDSIPLRMQETLYEDIPNLVYFANKFTELSANGVVKPYEYGNGIITEPVVDVSSLDALKQHAISIHEWLENQKTVTFTNDDMIYELYAYASREIEPIDFDGKTDEESMGIIDNIMDEVLELSSSVNEIPIVIDNRIIRAIGQEISADSEMAETDSNSFDELAEKVKAVALWVGSFIFTNVEINNKQITLLDKTDEYHGDKRIPADILNRIKNALNKAGYNSYKTFIDAFLKTFSIEQVSGTYYQFLENSTLSDFEFLSKHLPEEDSISDDFESEFTEIKHYFPEITNYKEIHSTEREQGKSGLISMIDVDMLKTGEIKVDSNSFFIVDMTRGKYARDKMLKENEEDPSMTNQYIGILPVVTTPINALYYQNILHAKKSFVGFNPVSKIQTVYDKDNNMLSSIGTNFDIALSADSVDFETLGSIATNYFPTFSYLDQDRLDPINLNDIGIVVFRMGVNSSNQNRITFTPVETFVGSLDSTAKDPITNSSKFIDDVVNGSSTFINVFSNVPNARKADTYFIHDQTATSLGFFESQTEKTISLDKSIKEALDLIFKQLSDTNKIDVDLVIDAGVSTIAQFIGNIGRKYDPSEDNSKFTMTGPSSVSNWRTIVRKYENFCANTRKDCMFVCDAPRNLCLQGEFPVIRKFKIGSSVKSNIIPYIKYLTGINTSYGAGYCNWFRCLNEIDNSMIWLPPSIKAAGIYLKCDVTEAPGTAPAGINRGKISNCYDVAFNPTLDEAESIYVNNWNYAISYPLYGIVLEGQKTFQKNQTAFDRVNVRRLFLSCERGIKNISRQFLYEGITDRLISRFNDSIDEFMLKVKMSGGCVDYYIVCDDRNNTPDTIDNNELHATIGIKPTKTAEFIVLNFLCTSQAANVEEVTSQSI